MEIWNRVLLIFVGIAGALVLISVAINFWKTDYFQEKKEIEGEKDYVIRSIVDLIYDCFDENTPRRKSVICEELVMESSERVFSLDILNSIDTSRMDKSKVEADDLGYSSEIIIRYENQIVYVQKVEHERIST